MLQILERLRGLTFSANTKERQMTNYTKLRFWNSFLSFEIRGAWSSNSSLKISSQVEIVGFEKCRGHFETADRAKMVCAGGNRKGSCFVSAFIYAYCIFIFICILHNHLSHLPWWVGWLAGHWLCLTNQWLVCNNQPNALKKCKKWLRKEVWRKCENGVGRNAYWNCMMLVIPSDEWTAIYIYVFCFVLFFGRFHIYVCQGDSGGPLTKDGVLVGVVSGGDTTGEKCNARVSICNNKDYKHFVVDSQSIWAQRITNKLLTVFASWVPFQIFLFTKVC